MAYTIDKDYIKAIVFEAVAELMGEPLVCRHCNVDVFYNYLGLWQELEPRDGEDGTYCVGTYMGNHAGTVRLY